MDKGFIWYPSFSSAGIAQELKKGFKIKGELPTRFYGKEFPEQFRYKYFSIMLLYLEIQEGFKLKLVI